VFKVLMAVAGLESGAVSPDRVVFCGGATTIHGRRRLCWKRGGHGAVDLRHALAQSCNVYFYQLGQALDIDVIHDFGDRFNLGRPTGVDLPGETSGILPSRAWKAEHLGEPWYPGDTISVAIGQGLLAVTPLQMAVMMAAVSTGGHLPRPHVSREAAGEPRVLAVRPETFRVVRQALREAVEGGTGRRAELGGVEVAGKTGTAQLSGQSAGIDADVMPKAERDHAWFAGYAPADRPRIAFAVVVEHGGHGGTSAAPVARRVLEVFFSGAVEPTPESRDEQLAARGDRRRGAAPASG
jgi:penicillin-binding protein 2